MTDVDDSPGGPSPGRRWSRRRRGAASSVPDLDDGPAITVTAGSQAPPPTFRPPAPRDPTSYAPTPPSSPRHAAPTTPGATPDDAAPTTSGGTRDAAPASTSPTDDPAPAPTSKARDRADGPTSTTTKAPRPAIPPIGGATTTTEILSNVDDGTSAAEKNQRQPADWAHFAPRERRRPAWLTAVAVRTRGVRRVVAHEWTAVIVIAIVVASALNWAAFVDIAHRLPGDLADSSASAYVVAWVGHALMHDPGGLWRIEGLRDSGLRDSGLVDSGVAFADPLFGYAPLAAIGTGQDLAVLRLNVLLILAQALAFVGGYALARQLGTGRVGATVAAIACAAAPWRLGQPGNLALLSTGGIALALAMLARGHGVRWRRPGAEPRPGWALAGWLVAAWQVSLGLGPGLVFAYVVVGAVAIGTVVWLVRGRRRPRAWLLVADGLGALVFAGAALLMTLPYRNVADRVDAGMVDVHSPPWRGLLTAPEHSFLWGGQHSGARDLLSQPAEMALLPGFALGALAIAGLVFSVWSWWVRLALTAGVAASIVLVLGTHGPRGGRAGYLWLVGHAPGFDGLATSGTLIVWTTLLLALLAAGGVGALIVRAGDAAQRLGLPRPTTMARVALLLPAALMLVEGVGTTPYHTVPSMPMPPAALSAVADAETLPADGLTRDVHPRAVIFRRF